MSITKRIDAVTEIQEEYLDVMLPAPKSVKIELTSRCNFACGFCAHRLRTDKMNMEWDFFKRITKEMLVCGVQELGLFYIGESLLCDWLPEAIRYAKKIGYPYVFLTTNGSLMTEIKAQAIMEAGLDSLKFSYNNSDPFQFRYITGMAPSLFEKIQDNIRDTFYIREKENYKTKLYASSILYDGSQHSKMVNAVNKILPFVDEHYWLPLYSFGSQATEKEIEMGYKPTPGNQGRIGALRKPLPCWAVFKEGHICVDGKLSACCFDIGEGWIMGDLKTTPFMQAWNSEEFRKLREAHLRKDITGTACEHCATVLT